MALAHGYEGSINFDGDDVADVQRFTYAPSVNTQDVTAIGDTARRRRSTRKDGTISVEANWNPDDTAQEKVRRGSEFTLILTTGAGHTFTGTAIVQTHRFRVTRDGVVKLEAQLMGYLTES